MYIQRLFPFGFKYIYIYEYVYAMDELGFRIGRILQVCRRRPLVGSSPTPRIKMSILLAVDRPSSWIRYGRYPCRPIPVDGLSVFVMISSNRPQQRIGIAWFRYPEKVSEKLASGCRRRLILCSLIANSSTGVCRRSGREN